MGKLVSPSKRMAGGLLVEDVRSSEDRVVFRLGWSKTDQRGKGVDVFLYPLPGWEVCPVREFLGVRPGGDGPFLQHGNVHLCRGFSL